ncbi:DUF4307 domain-containing protein [Spiractinospora alimapuensis]|uniref:DUF4307 domain-containing protein n=1 Tax=Spiractinospora alimapuensis TaxID=2820884 RepID=UPI001F37506A|nr:DUF4307 domain-containing protein [Spiractinospora alimapuensis]QVQ51438.1 DUF4307 domain-containing protein [Spiractinospora alimapuensis]
MATSDENIDDGLPEATPQPRRRRRELPFFALLAIGVVTVIAAGGWGIATVSYGGGAYGVPHQMVAWNATSEDSVSITFQVNSSTDAACLVRALDERHVEVGQDEVQVDSGLRDVTHTLRTTRQAAAAEVTSCRELES